MKLTLCRPRVNSRRGVTTLNEYGLLAPGVHDLSLDEVAALFGRFQRSDRRPRLMAKLRAFAADVRLADPRIELLVDGSFVMGCVDEPGDVDVILVLPAGWDWAAERRPFEYNPVSRQRVRQQYGFDLLLASADDLTDRSVPFFSQVNPRWTAQLNLPQGLTKGLVRVRP